MKSPRRPRRFVRSKALGLVAAFVIITIGTTVPAQRLALFPERVSTAAGQDVIVPWSRWLPVSVASGRSNPIMIGGATSLDLKASRAGHYLLKFRLFGWIPWRGLPVDVTKPVYVVPGGESVGVLVHTRGLVVTALTPIVAAGRTVDPAEAAGIDRGDVVTRVDGRAASSVRVLTQRVARDGLHHRPVHLLVQGARSLRVRTVVPVWAARSRRYQIGAAVQDRTSGVGTVTFFNPTTWRFTALGHSMTDGLTRRPVALAYGRATGAEIVGLVPATDSQPGQKVGVLAGPDNISGTVFHNGVFGIVGQLSHAPIWGPSRPLPLALPDQVRSGPAEILTVLHGQTPEPFRINIVKTVVQHSPGVKGLLFKVTDPRLLREAGGIVQGMSGSPIIQNGRVVGAVTHVLLNRPSLGYGCYAYWMAEQSSYK